MKFMTRILCSTFIIGTIVSATVVEENQRAQDSLTSDTKTQSKRGAEDNRQSNANLNSATNPSSTVTNLPQFYGGHFAQLGNFFASAAAPQIYYVKAPQSNHAGVQYAPANALKVAYAPQPQHSVAYSVAPTNAKVSIASQPLYQPYQLTYTHQPLSYSPSAIAVPYNHQQQQQIIPFAQANGYQFAAIPHQQVQVSQPYSYVTTAPSDAGKVAHTPNQVQAQTHNGYHQQQTFTVPTYQHVAAPINIPTTQKFVAFPSYSSAQYKTINGQATPSATTATHTASDGATSFATFSQQLNQRHHTTPTAVTPVKVLAQPQQYYVTGPPAGYSAQKIAFQPIAAASSSPQAYESPHNGVIHYGAHLYHPLAKYGQIAPLQKLIYSH